MGLTFNGDHIHTPHVATGREISAALRDAAERLRASHPTRPHVTVTATLRVAGDADLGDCRPVYAARADGGGFVPWSGTGGTLEEAVAECVTEMGADPDAGLIAECGRRGYVVIRQENKVPS